MIVTSMPSLPGNLATLPGCGTAPDGAVASAVLIALLERGPDGGAAAASETSASRNIHGDAPHVILTERAAHLRRHAGQISFPGGRLEAGEDAATAALREAEEEVGLMRGQVEPIGYLPPVTTGFGFHITPVVGRVRGEYIPRMDRGEVARIFTEPLLPLLDPANHIPTPAMPATEERPAMRPGWRIRHDREIIWGATARMIVQWARLLYPDGKGNDGGGKGGGA